MSHGCLERGPVVTCDQITCRELQQVLQCIQANLCAGEAGKMGRKGKGEERGGGRDVEGEGERSRMREGRGEE